MEQQCRLKQLDADALHVGRGGGEGGEPGGVRFERFPDLRHATHRGEHEPADGVELLVFRQVYLVVEATQRFRLAIPGYRKAPVWKPPGLNT